MLIIAMLIGVSTISYGAIQERSRDGRRKTDLSQIQTALEQYRAQSTTSTYPASLAEGCAESGGVSDGSNTYLASVPHDPRCATYTYYYAPVSNDAVACAPLTAPCACDGVTIMCDDYTLAAYLENENEGNVCIGNPSDNLCGTADCSYCLTPYGDSSN